MGAADRLRPCFGQAEMLDLAFLNQVLHRACHIFDRHFRIDAVLIEQVDDFALEAPERGLGNLFDMLRPAVEPASTLSCLQVDVMAELGCDHNLPADGGQGFADEFLAGERSIGFGGVEEPDAALDGRPEQADQVLSIARRTVALAHSHAAEPKGRGLETVSKLTDLHRLSPLRRNQRAVTADTARR